MLDNYPRDVMRECRGKQICHKPPLRNTPYCMDCFILRRHLTDDRSLDVEIRLAIAEGSLALLAEIVGNLTGFDES